MPLRIGTNEIIADRLEQGLGEGQPTATGVVKESLIQMGVQNLSLIHI